jgi:hypothetical protein
VQAKGELPRTRLPVNGWRLAHEGTEQRSLPSGFWAPARKSARAFTVALVGTIMGALYVCLAVFTARWRSEWPVDVLYLVVSGVAVLAGLEFRRRERSH